MKTAISRMCCSAMAFAGLVVNAFGIDAPTGLAVKQVDYTQAACSIDCSAQLSWTAPSGAPTGYKVYRRLAAHEQPTLAGEVTTTSFTDSSAAVGETYLYTVTAVDAGGESEESASVSYRRLENVAFASKGNVTLNNPTLESGAVANVNDGKTDNDAVCKDNFAANMIVLTFKDGRRPRLVQVRLNFGAWGDNKIQKFYGHVLRDGAEVATEFNGSATIVTHNFTQGAWNQFAVAASLQGDVWTKLMFGGGNYYGNCREVEAYGYLPSTLLGTPSVAEPIVGDAEAVICWTAAANAASYTVYRKAGAGAWTAVASGLKVFTYKDTGLSDGMTYAYRVAAVSAKGDESSDEAGVSITARAQTTDIPAAYGLAAAAIDFTQANCNIDCSANLTWSLVSAACYDSVRVYRFIKGHEGETPAPIATLAKATTTYKDSAATVGREYLYKVACYDSATDKGGPLSEAIAYRKATLVSKQDVNGKWAKTSGEDLTSWNNWKTWGNLSDGVAGTGSGIRIEGNGTLVYTWTSTARPKLVAVRAMSANMNGETAFICKGTVVRSGVSTAVAFDGGSTTVTFPVGVWTVRTVAAAYADDVWGTMTLANSTGNWQYPCFSEVEAYGCVPGDTTAFLAAPELSNPEAGKKSVSLVWTAAANAVSYKVYRKVADGDWVLVFEGLTGTTASDSGVTFDGTTYIYRVAAIAANGDELSSEEKTVLCPAAAPLWWNFLNAKSVAYPGASAYSNPSQVKPHYMSRDKAGTLLVAPMSTDNGTHPAVTFDFAALASSDSLGELTLAQTGMKQYGIATDFGGGIDCWKGAAVSADLVVIGNGTSGSTIAVIDRATGACEKYGFLSALGVATAFTMDGGLDFDAAGEYLYSNDGTVQNKIVKWQVDTTAKTVKKIAEYTADAFTRIRNLAIYTVGGEEYAFFGEGSAKTGKLGALKLSDGTFTTLVTDTTTLGGDVMNVKLAQADGDTYVVAQLDDAAVGVYLLATETMTATLVKAIDAATMKALYGTAEGSQYRNFEMTADGRYAFVMNNAGAATRLTAIGATERLLPDGAPALTVTCDYANKFTPTLTWTEGDGVLAESVRLFRAQVGKPGATALADVSLGVGTYTDDAAIAGVPYAYSVAYVHTVNGKALVGTRSAEVEATALIDLKTKKKAVLTSDSEAQGTVNNLFDDNTSTVHGYSKWGEKAAMQFTERVQLMAVRYWPKEWGTIHRGDNLKVYGKVANGTAWTTGLTQVGTGPVVSAETWYDVTLNGSGAPADGWDYIVLASGYGDQPYLNLCEVDFYGALPGVRAAAMEKPSESARDDAPTAAKAGTHTLSWTESGTLTGVRILRARTAEGPWIEVGRVAAGVGAFTDTSAVDGVVYHYRLAYLNEFEGVVYEGTPGEVLADYGELLSENGKASASCQYLRTTYPVIASDYNNGPTYLFDGKTDNSYNNDAHAKVGQAFRAPVVVKYVRIHTLGWAASDTYPRADNIGIYGAPADWSGVSEKTISSMSGAVKIGASPATCRGEKWFDCTLTDTDSAWSYLVLSRNDWYGNLREVEFCGSPQSVVEAAKAAVVWSVENVAARMDDTTLSLSWTLPNSLATSITVKHRVSGGAWAEIATLDGTATSLETAEVAIGRYNEYRFEVSDGTEVVWAAKDFAICPLLSKGTRTAVGCTATTAWDYLPVDLATAFTANFELSGSTQSALGLTPGIKDGSYIDLAIRKTVGGNPAAKVQRHWVYGNTLGLNVYDPGAKDQPYTIPWAAENSALTRFRIGKTGSTYWLKTGLSGGALTNTTTYAFVGKEPVGAGPCLVGVFISDPNLKALPQIAPIKAKVSYPGTLILVR